jgi:hypothetical protein
MRCSSTHVRPVSTARNKGSITTTVAAWWVLTLLSVVAIAHTGEALLSRQRVQHAADAVALAWVSQGGEAGLLVSSAYEVTVIKTERDGDRVRVWVRLGDHIASATAQYTQ